MKMFKRPCAAVWCALAGVAFGQAPPAHAQDASQAKYICPPCGVDCHDTLFDEPGDCSVCHMGLVEQHPTRNVAILLWDGIELLDFSGPGEVFTSVRVAGDGAYNVYTVAATADPIVSQGFLTVMPEYTIDNCPPPDILIVPGGGVGGPLSDERVVDWVREAAEPAEIVFSVCTGARILAKAGLLDGLEATTFHGAIERLRKEAPKTTVHADRRFVDNGKVVTAAGVSAGIDAALHIVSRLQGSDIAKKTAFYMEYEPRKAKTASLGSDDPAPNDRTANLPKAESSDIWIESGSIRLRATFHRLLTDDGRPTPAAVLVHGSAPSPRSSLGFYVDACLRAGLSVLAYDKRGCGESTGEYRQVTVAESERMLGELAADAAAGFAWLKNQEGVDPDRIGFVGGSQAGWIMPLAATLQPSAAFIVAGAGCPLSYGEEVFHGNLSGDGSGEESQVRHADLALADYDGPSGFDPGPTLKTMGTPMLWVFMTADSVIPTSASIARVESLIKAGQGQHSIYLLEEADHNFMNTKTGSYYQLTPIIKRWLAE